MAVAQIGPLTTTLEAAATAVGAGVVVFGVATGVVRLTLRRSRRSVEDGAATGGYVGGAFGAAVAVADLVLRYAGLK
jgi:hypothetical protein